MRWFVEISSLGQKPAPNATLCVEAPQWQPALQKARAIQGDDGPLSNFSIELLEDGFRAIDPGARRRYEVRRAPDDAAITTTPIGPAKTESAPASKEPAPASKEPEKKESAPAKKQRTATEIGGYVSPLAAAVDPPAAAKPSAAEAEAESKRKRQEAITVSTSSRSLAAVRDGAQADRAAPPPAAPAAALPRFDVVSTRSDDPSERSPLSYRELVYAVPLGTTEEEARRLILERFAQVRSALDGARAGKLVNLAVFDHAFAGKPLRRPLVTLTWKDWKADAPEIRFPQSEPAGETPTPLAARASSPPVSSPPISSPAISAPAASPQASIPIPLATRAAEPAPKISSPAQAAPAPASSGPAIAPVAAGPTLSSRKPDVTPVPDRAPEVPVVVLAAPQAAVPAPVKVDDAPKVAAIVPAPIVAVTAEAKRTDAKPADAKPADAKAAKASDGAATPARDRESQPAAAAIPPTRVIPTVVSPAPAEPARAATEPAEKPAAVEKPAAAKPAAQPAIAPTAVSRTVPSRNAAPAKRLSGEDLLSELFEAFSDLHFLPGALEGAEFVLNLTLEKLPSEVGMVSLFDMNKREFVVVRQHGGPRSALGARQPERAPLAITAMRKKHAVVVADPAGAARAVDDRWRAIGVEPKSLICAPVELGGRYLGLIELANPLDNGVYTDGDGNALTYIGQQFAEFVATHGVVVDAEAIREASQPPPAPAPVARIAPVAAAPVATGGGKKKKNR